MQQPGRYGANDQDYDRVQPDVGFGKGLGNLTQHQVENEWQRIRDHERRFLGHLSGLLVLPEPEAAPEGIPVIAEAGAGRYGFKLLGITASKYDAVGNEGSLEPSHNI